MKIKTLSHYLTTSQLGSKCQQLLNFLLDYRFQHESKTFYVVANKVHNLDHIISCLQKGSLNIDQLDYLAGQFGFKFVDVESAALPLPEYATPLSAGLDLRAAIEHKLIVAPGETSIVPTGLCIQLPEGTVGLICPRSGLAAKHSITVTNSPGILDADYTAEVKVILTNMGKHEFEIVRGDRIAQLVITPVFQVKLEVVDDLDETSRMGGFGSTGVK